MPPKRKVLIKWFSAAWSNSVFSYFVIQWILRWASASQDLPSLPVRHLRTAFWIKRNHLPGIHFSHCCQKFVWIMFGKKRKFLSGTVVYLCATTPYHSHLSSLSSSSWSSVASSRSSCSAFSLLLHLGPVSRKSRKAIRKHVTRLLCKVGLFICCKQGRSQKNSPTEALFLKMR